MKIWFGPALTLAALWGREGVHLLTGMAQCSHADPLFPPLRLLPSFLPSLPLYCCDMPRPHSGRKRRQCNLKLWNFFKNKKLPWAALEADLGRMWPSGRRLDKPALNTDYQQRKFKDHNVASSYMKMTRGCCVRSWNEGDLSNWQLSRQYHPKASLRATPSRARVGF